MTFAWKHLMGATALAAAGLSGLGAFTGPALIGAAPIDDAWRSLAAARAAAPTP